MSDQGWNTPNDPPSSPDQSGDEGNFWAKASKSAKPKKAARSSASPDDANWATTVDPRARRRRLIRRTLWISLAVVLVLGTTLALLLPTIASGFVPGIVKRAAADQIAGNVEVSGVSLSWSGPQVVEKFSLLDGVAPVVEAQLSVPVSLWSLIAGQYNLGKVDLSFDAEIARDKQGSTNLQRALAPAKNASLPSKDPARIPPSLMATIQISGSSITITDESAPNQRTRLRKLDAEIQLEVAKTLKVAFKGIVEGTTKEPFGTVEFDARVNKWSDDTGLITPKKLILDLAFKADQVPTPALDLLASMQGRLARALGERVDATSVIAYTPATSTATLRVTSTHASASLNATSDAARVSLSAESPIRLSDTFVREMGSGVQAALAKSGVVELDRWPGLVLTLTKASIPLPTGPDLALGEAEIDAVLEVDSAGGRVKLDAASPWKPLETRPVRLQLKAERLMRELSIKADAGARVAGEDAGTITIDLTAANAIDTYAGLTPERLSIKGTARVRSIATALLEPFVLDTGLRLATDIGPTLDIAIEGEQTAGAPAAAITITSAHLNAQARGTLTPDELRFAGDGATVTWSAAGAYLSRTLDPSSGWKFDPAGAATLRIPKATYSTAAAKGKSGPNALASALEADASLTLTGLKLLRASPLDPLAASAAAGLSTTDAIDLRDLTFTAALQPDRPYIFTLRAAAASGTAPFQLAADARINRPLDLLTPAPLEKRILASGLTADLRLTDTPAALAGLLVPSVGSLVADLSDALGSRVNATATIKEDNGLIALRADAALDRATIALRADLGKGSAKISTLSLTSALDRPSLDRLLKALGVSSATGDLQLQGSLPLVIALNPVTIPITPDLVPQPQSDQVLTASISTTAPTTWTITPRATTATVSSALGDRVTIEPVALEITAAPATILGEGGIVRASLTGGARTAGGARLGDLSITSSLALAQGRPNGPLQLQLNARAIDCALLGAMMSDPGLPVALVGPSADAQLDLDARLLPDGPATRLDRLTATASISGARTRTETPLKLRLSSAGRIELESPLKIVSTPDTQWLNQTLTRAQAEPRIANSATPPSPPSPPSPPRTPITFANLTPVMITLDKLSLASTIAPGQLPIPEEFDLLVETSQAALAGIDRGPLRLSSLKLRTRWTDPRRAELLLDVGSAQLGDQPATGPMKLSATIRDALSSGGVSMQTAKINAEARLPLLPTALIDALAAQGGLLNELLGTSAGIVIKGADYDAGGQRGSAAIEATSPRATATLAGTFDSGAFRSTSPVEITITEVSPGLSAILAGKQPVFGIIEKRAGDQPARFTSQALSVPLAGDMSMLDGDMVIELGEARVALSPSIGKLLKPLTAAEGAAKLLRYEPLNIAARKGVLQLSKWTFPLDQFTFQTQGSIDLVKREVDLITWVPAGALTGETLGAVFKQFGALTGKQLATIDDKVLVPLRTRGSLNSPVTTPEFNAETLDEFKKLAGRFIEDQIKSKGQELIKERIPGLGGVPQAPGFVPPKP